MNRLLFANKPDNQNVFFIEDCSWGSKTPFASIRRIVRNTKGIYRIKPGLYALESHRQELENNGIIVQDEHNQDSEIVKTFNHSYYQGLLLEMGKSLTRPLADSWWHGLSLRTLAEGYGEETLYHHPDRHKPGRYPKTSEVELLTKITSLATFFTFLPFFFKNLHPTLAYLKNFS